MAAAIGIAVAVLVALSMANTGEAAGAVDCTTVVLSMAECLSYVSNGSRVETPEGNCCSGLKSVLKTNAECLCEAFKSSAQFGVILNVSKALALPQACHVHASSADNCGLSDLSPATAPVAGALKDMSTTANAPTIEVVGNEVTPTIAPSKTSYSTAISSSVEFLIVGITVTYFLSS